jgi:hypothetical protein
MIFKEIDNIKDVGAICHYSRNAYTYTLKSALPSEITEEKYIPAEDDDGVLLVNDDLYRLRFANFSERFYKIVNGVEYPTDYINQGIIYEDDKKKILFLGLNSCWEIDHHEPYQARSSINMDALANALSQLMDVKYDQWLKIVVFHHPISGPEIMKNTDFIQQLAAHGFQICMNGHVHEASENLYKYDNKRKIHIIGAGTFGAPKREQAIGIPLQYNFLILDLYNRRIRVETRRKEKPNGAWEADARWGDKNNPEPRYFIDL